MVIISIWSPEWPCRCAWKADDVVCCESPFRQSKDEKAGRTAVAMTRREKNENEVRGRSVDRVAFDGGGNGCIGTRSDAGGERQGATVSGDDEEECFGGDKRSVGTTVELQAGTGPLVGGAGNAAHRGSGRFYPWDGEGKDHDGAGRRARPRCEEDGRRRAGDGSRPHEQGASAGAASADKPFRVARSLDQAFRREPGDHGGFSENCHGPARSRRGQLDGYEFVLLIAAHSERHTKQINEVKADPNFPKK